MHSYAYSLQTINKVWRLFFLFLSLQQENKVDIIYLLVSCRNIQLSNSLTPIIFYGKSTKTAFGRNHHHPPAATLERDLRGTATEAGSAAPHRQATLSGGPLPRAGGIYPLRYLSPIR